MAAKTTKKAAAKIAADPVVTDDETTEQASTPPEQPNPEAAAEFPALEGEPGVEVSERSADQTDPDTMTHRKEFVLLAADYDNGDKAEIHRANVGATRQYLISQGMRPTGDGKFVSSKKHPDGLSVSLFYDVPVVPAVIAQEGDPEVHDYVQVDDQHAAETGD